MHPQDIVALYKILFRRLIHDTRIIAKNYMYCICVYVCIFCICVYFCVYSLLISSTCEMLKLQYVHISLPFVIMWRESNHPQWIAYYNQYRHIIARAGFILRKKIVHCECIEFQRFFLQANCMNLVRRSSKIYSRYNIMSPLHLLETWFIIMRC